MSSLQMGPVLDAVSHSVFFYTRALNYGSMFCYLVCIIMYNEPIIFYQEGGTSDCGGAKFLGCNILFRWLCTVTKHHLCQNITK